MHTARKILVTGNAGSGKTTVSKYVSEKHGIPWYTLDKIVWQEYWQKTPPPTRSDKISALVQKDEWIIDGVDYQVMQAADLVIFLDVSRTTSYLRVLKRNPRYLFSSREELPPHCPEILIIPYLIRLIWRFPKRVRPKLLQEKERRTGNDSFIHITSQSDLDSYFASIP